MITLTVTYQMPEDQDDFQRAHYAQEAWSAINESLQIIRQHYKHDAWTPEQALDRVKEVLYQAYGRLE